MEQKIYDLLRKHKLPLKKREDLIKDLLLLLRNSTDDRNLLVEFLEFGKAKHYTPLTQCGIMDMVDDFMINSQSK